MNERHTYGLVNKMSSYFFVTMSVISVVIGLSFLYGTINWFFIGKEVTPSFILFIVGSCLNV